MEFEVPTEKVKPRYPDDEIGENRNWEESGLERRRTNGKGQNGNGKSFYRYPVSKPAIEEGSIPIGPIRPHNTSFAGFYWLNRISSGQPQYGLGPNGPGPQTTPDTAQSQSQEGFPQSFPEE